MELNNDQEIINFIHYFHDVTSERSENLYMGVKINYVSNPILLIENGFLPDLDIVSTLKNEDEDEDEEYMFGIATISKRQFYSLLMEAYFLQRYSEEEIRFWFRDSFSDIIDLYHFPHWFYATIDVHKVIGWRTGLSFSLLMYAPQETYSSRRPKTNMIQFLNPKSTNNSIRNDYDYIPVTRYAEDAASGLYFTETSEKFCGTFYYREPESKIYLGVSKHRVKYFRNKFFAAKYFLENSAPEEFTVEKSVLKNIMSKEKGHLGLFDYLKGQTELPDNLLLTPLEIYTLLPDFFPGWSLEQVMKLAPIPRYIGLFLGYYAQEDVFDQLICIMAVKMGIDVIVLTHMVGFHQVVTEVLDTRDRAESFDNLVYT